MYQFKHIQPTYDIWAEIENASDSTCFASQKWYLYLQRIGHNPFLLSVTKNLEIIGYFIGEKLLFGSFSIISAPQSNSGTYTLGLCMKQLITHEERVAIYQELATWLFATRQASVLQVDDWQLRITSAQWIPYEVLKHEVLEYMGVSYSMRPTLCVPVNTSEEEMWAKLHYKSCK